MLPLRLPKQPNERRILTLRLAKKPADPQSHDARLSKPDHSMGPIKSTAAFAANLEGAGA
jgi:hypothetical protein